MAALGLLAFSAGCDMFGFLGAPEAPPLPGERVSVLRLNRSLEADADVADLRVRLPQPIVNGEWPQAGGYASHAMHHLALAEAPSVRWTADIGTGASSDERLLAEPVVAGGRVYALDAANTVSAFDAGSGSQSWSVDLTPDEEDDGLFGGGLAYADGAIYATTPFALVFKLNADTGQEVWRSKVSAPVRTPPTVSDGRVFVVTIDNQLLVLAAEDGRRLWSHAGITEAAGLLGGAAPAVLGSTAIVGYSSGDIYALRAETGRVLWNDNLAGAARTGSVATLTDIRGRPVIDRDLVVAISNSGTIAAIDLARGERVWERDLGGTQSPWVAGDFVYVVGNNAEIVCLTRRDGRIRWIASLPAFEDEENQEDPILWHGPVLAGDRLIVTGSNGEAIAVSPYTGEYLGQIELPAAVELPPVVAGETLYFLSNGADLMALK
jgi:outer membrane protein assembly factor BamB